MRTSIAAAIWVTAAIVTSASARQIENWPYDRLFKEADVIVIASAQKTVDSDDVAPERWKRSLVGQRTTFSVITTLKGTLPGGPITVVYFKLKDGVMPQDGPMLVRFRTKEITIEGGGRHKYNVQLGPPDYLLFLKRSAGGRLEPVSGQVDAKLSVKEIYAPLPAQSSSDSTDATVNSRRIIGGAFYRLTSLGLLPIRKAEYNSDVRIAHAAG